MTRQTLEEQISDNSQYLSVIECCKKHLMSDRASFEKDAVLRETGLRPLAKGIRWDIIVKILEKDPEISLMAVAETFFKEKVWLQITKFTAADDERARVLAGRYTATGHAKRTAGYATATLHGGRLLLYRMRIAALRKGGIEEAMKKKIVENLSAPSLDAKVAEQLGQMVGIAPPTQIQ